MISVEELKKLSNTRLKDAAILHSNERYAASIYLVGYAVEIALKSVIARALSSSVKKSLGHMPHKTSEIDTLKKMMTHNLEDLLALTPGRVKKEIGTKRKADWSLIQSWNSEIRYEPLTGTKKELQQKSMESIDASKRLTTYLLRSTARK